MPKRLSRTLHRRLRVCLFAGLCVCLISCVSGADAAPAAPTPTPKPRKRLGNPDQIDNKWSSQGNTIIGAPQNVESRYLNSINYYICDLFNARIRGLPDEPTIKSEYKVKLKVDTVTNEVLDMAVVGTLSERRRMILKACAAEAVRKMPCPAELGKKYGRVLSYDIGLVVNAH